MTHSAAATEAPATRSSRRRAVRLVVAAVAVALVAAPAAASASTVPGDWWYDRFGVAEVQAEGWDGAGVKVAVIDEQIDSTLPVFSGTALTVPEPGVCGGDASTTNRSSGAMHGSNVTALLIGNGEGDNSVRGIAPRAEVTFYGLGDGVCRNLEDDSSDYAQAIDRAVADGADIITTSMIFATRTGDDEQAIADALAAGVVVVAGIPNELVGDEAEQDFPWSFNGVVSVGAFGPDGAINADFASGGLNIQPEVTVVAPGDVIATTISETAGSTASGTSYATPLVAGILANVWQKYPDATANQLIQSLIHNTGPEDHPLERDTANGYGYGPASLRHMLSVDPTQYPDENPLMDKASGAPTAEQVAAAGAATTEPETSGEPTTAPDAGGTGDAADPTLWIVGGVVGIVVIGALVTIVVVTSRQRARRSNGGVS